MDSHSLIEMAHMLNGVCLAIIHGESGLSESSKEFYSSILRVKGDLEIWFNALLIASFPTPFRGGLTNLRS